MGLPVEVDRSVELFLATVDKLASGWLTGFHLVGSLAFGDFHPRGAGRGQLSTASDIDFVAVAESRAEPGSPEMAALAEAHARTMAAFPKPNFDGSVFTPADLAGGPDSCPDVPGAQGGRFSPAGRFGVNPVTFCELAWHGITVRGPQPRPGPGTESGSGSGSGSRPESKSRSGSEARPGAESESRSGSRPGSGARSGVGAVDVWADMGALRAYTVDNLRAYWRPWWERNRRLRPLPLAIGVSPWFPVWAVLGVSRLHHLLHAGTMTSKCGAGRYALKEFDPRWHRIVAESLHLRTQGAEGRRGYRNPLARRRDTLAFLDATIEAALRA